MPKQSINWCVGQECAHLEKGWYSEHATHVQKGEVPSNTSRQAQAWGSQDLALWEWAALTLCDGWGGGR